MGENQPLPRRRRRRRRRRRCNSEVAMKNVFDNSVSDPLVALKTCSQLETWIRIESLRFYFQPAMATASLVAGQLNHYEMSGIRTPS